MEPALPGRVAGARLSNRQWGGMYMIIIRTDAQTNRKALVGALSELFHEKPRYCGAPTFSYEFGVGQLARDAC